MGSKELIRVRKMKNRRDKDRERQRERERILMEVKLRRYLHGFLVAGSGSVAGVLPVS